MYKFLLLVVFYILVSILSFAAKINGTIKDDADGKPLQSVMVVVKELNKVTETDSNGYFEIDNVESGTYEMIFSLLTYREVHQTVSVLNNRNVKIDIKLRSESNTLKDVTVRANRITYTENAVMMEIRKSHLTVSGISAAQISKTADRNAADVVRRLPGVTIFDERFIVVRGLHDRYNTVWLNDAGAPSSEADKKSFSFDLVPSGVIDRMMIYKTPAPELPGDFAGGMVKIYTSSLPERNQVNVGFQTSYRQNTTGKPFFQNPSSKTDWLGYDDGMRSLPENTPAYISKNDSNNTDVSRAFGKNTWDILEKTARPDFRFNLKAANVFNLGRVKLGNTVGLSYSNLNEGFEVIRQSRDSITREYHNIDARYSNEVNATLMDNVAAVIGNSKFEFKNLYNQYGASRLVLRGSVPDSTQQDERSYIMEYESRAVYSSQLSGTHKSTDGKRSYNWTLGYSDLFKNIPDLRRLRYGKQFGEDDSMYSAQTANVVDPVYGGGRYFAQLFEKVYSFNHHFSQKLSIKNYEFEVSLGNFVEYKSRTFYQRVLGYTINPTGANRENATRLRHLPVSEIFADSNVGGRNMFRLDEITSKSDQYSASNQLIASYIAVSLPYKDKLNISGGVRFEHNTQKLKGYVDQDSIMPEIVTQFLLPSVNISYNINEKMLVRAAYGKTLNRPEFRENAPIFYYDMEERWGVYGAMWQTTLQDTLKVAQIHNFDARWEWYPSQGEMVHAGIFYKHFKDPIQFYIESPGADSRRMTYINSKEAYSAGVEIDVRKSLSPFDKWLGTKIFSDFSIVGNVTILKSEMKIEDTLRGISTTTMQGQSPYMYNAGLFYQNDKYGFQGSFLYNVYGPRMIALGDRDVADIGELPFHSMDLMLSKIFFKHYTLTLGAQNLLNSTNRRMQDQNKDGKYDKQGSTDSDYRVYTPGRYYSLGIKVKF